MGKKCKKSKCKKSCGDRVIYEQTYSSYPAYGGCYPQPYSSCYPQVYAGCNPYVRDPYVRGGCGVERQYPVVESCGIGYNPVVAPYQYGGRCGLYR